MSLCPSVSMSHFSVSLLKEVQIPNPSNTTTRALYVDKEDKRIYHC